MKTINYVKSTWGRLGAMALLLFAAAALASCSDDDTREGFIDLQDGPDHLSYTVTGGAQTYKMYSNWNEWHIVVDYDSEDQTWVDVWPNKGKADGRFTITVGENANDAYHRTARVTIIADNRVRKVITVEQDEVASVLELDMDGVTAISSTNRESSTTVKLKTNVYWEAEALNEAAEWIEFGEKTDNSLELIFERNTEMEPRTGYVNFVKVGTGNENVNVKVKVTQRGDKDDIDRATKTTIAALLADGHGLIEQNCYVEGYVTSDLTTRNTDSTFMFVQDESGRGLKVEFERQSDNTLKLNDKVKLHMVGQNLVTDNVNGGTKVTSFPLIALIGSEPGTGATPVEISDLSQLDDYENTLVTLKDVEFAIPYGTYVNIDEANYKASGNPTSIERGDTPRLYGHILRDSRGNTVKLYSGWQFTDKFKSLIPSGSGDLTGIVMKRTANGIVSNIIRLRSDGDNKVGKDESTRLSRTVIRFGPWKIFSSMSEIKADVGEGNLKTHLYKNCEVASGSNMYWSWTYARHVPTTLDADGNGVPAITSEGDKTGTIYSCLNQSDWLDAAGSSVEGFGGAWIANVSQKDMEITGDLSLSFTTSSSQTGPRDFTAEWADTEDTKNADWKTIGTYESCDWNSNYQLLQYNFRLPDELKSKESYVIRLRVTGKSNARSNGNYGTGGTNRIGYLEVSELK